MNSTKSASFIYLFLILLTLQACGGSNSSPLQEAFSVNGESYCDETNQVVDIVLANHFSKSEVDRSDLYNEAVRKSLADLRGLYDSSPYFLQLFDDFANGLKDDRGRYDSQRLTECEDLTEIHNYLIDSGVPLADERVVFWIFLHHFANGLDYYSSYDALLGGRTSHEFGIRLDLDLAARFNYVQESAEVLAVADPTLEMKPGDRVIEVSRDLLSPPSRRSSSHLNTLSIEEITSAKLGRSLSNALFASPIPMITLKYIPKDFPDEERSITMEGRTTGNALASRPLVQAELKGNIIYARLFQFDEGAAMELSSKLHSLKQEWLASSPDASAKLSIILDLRYNPGGYIPELQRVAGIFLPTGRMGTVRVRNSASRYLDYSDEEIYVESTGVIFDEPMVVLANNGSASAADMLTQVLADTKRAYFVGTPTHGKGIQQISILLGVVSKLGGYLKFTNGRIYGIDGTSVQNMGKKPDLLVEDELVQELIEKCKQDMSRNCRSQFMKDIPSDRQIDADSISPLDNHVTALVQTDFPEEARKTALQSVKEVKTSPDKTETSSRVDVQRIAAESLLNGLSEPQAAEEPAGEEVAPTSKL